MKKNSLAPDTTASATICLLLLLGTDIHTCAQHSTESGSPINFIHFNKGMPHYIPIGGRQAIHWIMSLLPLGSLL